MNVIHAIRKNGSHSLDHKVLERYIQTKFFQEIADWTQPFLPFTYIEYPSRQCVENDFGKAANDTEGRKFFEEWDGFLIYCLGSSENIRLEGTAGAMNSKELLF